MVLFPNAEAGFPLEGTVGISNIRLDWLKGTAIASTASFFPLVIRERLTLINIISC
nr:hypothetical protein Q903MT_gene3250 [Picea sitchensis]